MQFGSGSWRTQPNRLGNLSPLSKTDAGEAAPSSNASSSQSPRRSASGRATTAELPFRPVSPQSATASGAGPMPSMGLVWTQSDLIDVCAKGVEMGNHKINSALLKAARTELKELRGDMKDSFRTQLQENMDLLRTEFHDEVSRTLDEIKGNAMTAQLVQMCTDIKMLQDGQKEFHTQSKATAEATLEQQRDLVQRGQAEVVQHLHDVQRMVSSVGDLLATADEKHQEESQKILAQGGARLAAQKRALQLEQEHWVLADEAAQEQSKHMMLVESSVQRVETEMMEMFQVQRKEIEERSKHIVEGILQSQQKDSQSQFVRDLMTEVEGTKSSVHSDVGVVLGEIGRIQKAMNMDFVVDTRNAGLQGIRVREYAVQTEKSELEQSIQTDVQPTHSQTVQTDESGERAHKKKVKRSSTRDMKAHQNNLQVAPRRNSDLSMKSAAQPQKKKQLFADAEAMKKKAREALVKKHFDVTDYYHNKGLAQLVARSPRFESLTFAVIFLNAIWIAVDIDLNDAKVITEAHPVFITAENAFCTYFTFEIVIRFFAFRRKPYCLKDNWFIFDFVLVALMVLETWVIMIVLAILSSKNSMAILSNLSLLRMVRLVKLMRMARLARLLRSVPELVILVKAIIVASRSVVTVFLLWLVIIYFYAMIFRQLTKGEDIGEQYFENVPASMNTLLLNGILPEIAVIMHNVSDANPLLWPLMLSFVILASLTVANMLVGVLVGVVGAVASSETEGNVVSGLASEMRAVFDMEGRALDSTLSKDDFQTLLVTPACACAAKEVGVDVIGLLDVVDQIYDELPEGAGLKFEELIDLVLSMRGTNLATVKDVKTQMKFFRALLDESMNGMNSRFENISRDIKNVSKQVLELIKLNEDSDDDDEDDPLGSHSETASPRPASKETSKEVM